MRDGMDEAMDMLLQIFTSDASAGIVGYLVEDFANLVIS